MTSLGKLRRLFLVSAGVNCSSATLTNNAALVNKVDGSSEFKLQDTAFILRNLKCFKFGKRLDEGLRYLRGNAG